MSSSFVARVRQSSGSTDAANVIRVMSDAGQAPTPTLDDIAEESRRVVAEAGAAGQVLRITGSVAFHLRAGQRVRLPRPPIQDIDLVAPSGSERRATKLLTELGYWGEREFNARHGA